MATPRSRVIRVPDELWDRVKALAHRRHSTPSAITRDALEAAVTNGEQALDTERAEDK